MDFATFLQKVGDGDVPRAAETAAMTPGLTHHLTGMEPTTNLRTTTQTIIGDFGCAIDVQKTTEWAVQNWEKRPEALRGIKNNILDIGTNPQKKKKVKDSKRAGFKNETRWHFELHTDTSILSISMMLFNTGAFQITGTKLEAQGWQCVRIIDTIISDSNGWHCPKPPTDQLPALFAKLPPTTLPHTQTNFATLNNKLETPLTWLIPHRNPKLTIAMQNGVCVMPWACNPLNLSRLISDSYGIFVKYQRESKSYNGVIIKLFHNDSPAWDGKCNHSPTCKLAVGPKDRKCILVTILAFGTGNILITGAKSPKMAEDAAQWITSLYSKHEDTLRVK